jgi:hypothetical protein
VRDAGPGDEAASLALEREAHDLAAGVGIGVQGDNRQAGLDGGLEGGAHLVGGSVRVGGDRVQDEEQERPGPKPVAPAQLVRSRQRLVQDAVQPRRADDVDVDGVLAHAPDAVGAGLGGREVEMGHLGDRVAGVLVVAAARAVAAVDVAQHQAGERGRDRRRQDLGSVPEDEHDVRAEGLVGIGHAHHAYANGLGGRRRIVTGQQRRHTRVDGEAVVDDVVLGVPQRRQQVHAGDHDLQPHPAPDLGHHRPQQAVLGTRAGHHADGPLRHRHQAHPTSRRRAGGRRCAGPDG